MALKTFKGILGVCDDVSDLSEFEYRYAESVSGMVLGWS